MSTNKGRSEASTEKNKKSHPVFNFIDAPFMFLLCDMALGGLPGLIIGSMILLSSCVFGDASKEKNRTKQITQSDEKSPLLSPISKTGAAAPTPINSKDNVGSGTDLNVDPKQNSKTTMRH